MKQSIKNLTIIGLIINTFLSIIKIIGGKLGASSALIADGVHSISDSITDFAIIFGVKFWTQKADKDHQYGHEKIEFIVSFCIGLILFIASFEIIEHELTNIYHNHVSTPSLFCAYVAFFSYLVKEFVYRWHKGFALKVKSQALLANAYHHRSDVFSSLVITISILIAVFCPKITFIDTISAVIVAGFIFKSGLDIIIPAFHSLTDKSLSNEDLEKLEKVILSCDNVVSFHKIRSRVNGAKAYLDLHVQVPNELSLYEAHKTSHIVKDKILENFPNLVDVLIHVEPKDD